MWDEFAIGVNPYVLHPMKDILFDEKIMGPFISHRATVTMKLKWKCFLYHWDLVWIQRPECGGGEIYFDDVLVRKDGRFVLPSLQCLNPGRTGLDNQSLIKP